ncbi:MAG: hypothetical protein DRG78_20970 [Epsilonproteobacteria bacterium]|nr:MAG: hypothetical protein DRG78_20970 [Campylobacterota bacterium]
MHKRYLIIFLMIFLFLNGCNDDGTIDAKTAKHDKQSSEAYATHQISIDQEINLLIKDILPTYESYFNERINQKISSTESNISNDTKNLLLKSMLYNFKSDAIKEIRKEIGSGLGEKYIMLHEELGFQEEGMEFGISSSQEMQIKDMVKNHFDNEISSSYVTSLLSPIAIKISDDMFEISSIQPMLLSTAYQAQDSSPQNDALQNAEETTKFTKFMKDLFDDYDENETGNNHGGAIDGGLIYGIDRVTDTFKLTAIIDRSVYPYTYKIVWRHTINEPSYNNGNLEIDTKIEDYDDPFDGNSVKVSTSADMDGDGYESLIIATCNNDNDTVFYEVGSRKENYEINKIFNVMQKIDCKHISDILAGDFDGDGKDELAVASSYGVHIFDDKESNYSFMTKYVEETGYSTGNTYKLVSKNVAGKSYDDLGVVVYNSKSDSTFKARAYLFEMNGMEYNANGDIHRDYHLYTLNSQKLNFTTSADIVMDDLEDIGRAKMYVIQLTDEEEYKKYDVDAWKERHDQSGIGYEPDNDWCTYRGYYKNHLELWSVDNSPNNPDANSIEPLNKIGKTSIINRISKTFKRRGGSCKDSEDIYLTKSNDGYSDSSSHGYLFSINEKIDALSYKKSKSDPYVISLNGLPLSYGDFAVNGNYEVSGLYDHHHYSANSKDSTKPSLSKTDYQYEDISLSDYNYINTYVEDISADSYFEKNAKTDYAADNYGNRDDSSSEGHGVIYSLGAGENEVKYGIMTYPNDSLIMKYIKHDVLYTDPQVLIYLSAPPVKAGQKTTFTYGTGSCDEESEKDSKSNGFTSGFSLLVGVSVDIPLISHDDVLAGFSTKYKWSREKSNFSSSSKCVAIADTISSDYIDDTNLVAQDKVKIRSEIIDSYVYEIVDDLNNPDNIGKKITINDTRKDGFGKTSHYHVWKDVDEYYNILDNNDREPYIDYRSLITHTPGKIKTYNDINNYQTTADGYTYSDFFATDDYQVQQDGNSDTESIGYSISSKNGSSTTDGNSFAFSIKAKVKATGGAVIQAKSEGTLDMGWTTANKTTYSSSHSDKASYKFKASGVTTQEETSGVYKYGVYTYSINKKEDDEEKGQSTQVIDFYISDY